MQKNREIYELNLKDILPNRFQPRITFDEVSINELAQSIKKFGVIQPIVVRKIGEKYEIIAGERRYKASVIAGKTTISAIIFELTDNESVELALLENIQREDLTPIEKAISYKKILDINYYSQEELAKKLGKSQSSIANTLRLLSLSDEVQEALLKSEISERHARSLLKLKSEAKQNEMLSKIVNERLTVRKLDEEISNMEFYENNKVVEIPETPKTQTDFVNIENIQSQAQDIVIEEKKFVDMNSLLQPQEVVKPVTQPSTSNFDFFNFEQPVVETTSTNLIENELSNQNNVQTEVPSFTQNAVQSENNNNQFNSGFQFESFNNVTPNQVNTTPDFNGINSEMQNNSFSNEIRNENINLVNEISNQNNTPTTEEVKTFDFSSIFNETTPVTENISNMEVPAEKIEPTAEPAQINGFDFNNNLNSFNFNEVTNNVTENIQSNVENKIVEPLQFNNIEQVIPKVEPIKEEISVNQNNGLFNNEYNQNINNNFSQPEQKFEFEVPEDDTPLSSLGSSFDSNIPEVEDVSKVGNFDIENTLYGFKPITEEEANNQYNNIENEQTTTSGVDMEIPSVDFSNMNIYNDIPTTSVNQELEKPKNDIPAYQIPNNFEFIDEPIIPVQPIQEKPKANLQEALRILRSAYSNIESLGFKVDMEEIDFEDLYQVTVKVDKD